MPAEECARQILMAVARKKEDVTIAARREKMLVYMKRFAPGLVTRLVAARAPGTPDTSKAKP